MPAQDSSTAPAHPHTEIDFAQGINLANLEQVSGIQLEQLIREATTSPNRALITVQDTPPDVTNNPHLKRYPWIKTADADKSKWVMRYFQGPATDETGWIIGSPQFAAGTLPLVAISTTGGVIGYFLGIDPTGKLAYLPVPTTGGGGGDTLVIPPASITPGTAWQFLLTSSSGVTQWKSFADYVTAHLGSCPAAFLAPGPANTYLTTVADTKREWVPIPTPVPEARLLPAGAANNLTLGVVANVPTWVDGYYIAGIIPINSIHVNKLKPVEGHVPNPGEMICWNGSMFINCPLFQFSALLEIPVGIVNISQSHGYTTPPTQFYGRLVCVENDPVGFVAGQVYDLAYALTPNDDTFMLYANNSHMWVRLFSHGFYPHFMPPDPTDPQNVMTMITIAKWRFQFIWV